MITCIVLDGWHRATVIRLPQYTPVLRLPRTRSFRITKSGVQGYPDDRDEYRACFHAVDGQIVLYSMDGRSDVFLCRDWIVPSGMRQRPLDWFVKVKDEEAP